MLLRRLLESSFPALEVGPDIASLSRTGKFFRVGIEMNGTPVRKICLGRVGTTITEPPMITGGPEVNKDALQRVGRRKKLKEGRSLTRAEGERPDRMTNGG